MKARGKGFLFIAVVICFIASSPLLTDSNGSAWAVYAPPSTYTVSGSITPSSDLSSVWFVGMYTKYSGGTGYFVQRLGNVLANNTTTFSFTTNYVDYPNYVNSAGSAPTAYTIFAVHGPGYIADAVTIGSNTISPGTPGTPGPSWPSLFAGYAQEPFSGMIRSGSAIEPMLTDFYVANAALLGTGMGSTLKLINFSNASAGGLAYASVSAVPLPAGLLLFGPGLAAIAVLRRRFGKK